MDIQGKVALVTGGASGIGLACVKELLNNGSRGVTIVDINEAGYEIAEELNNSFAENSETPKVIFAKANVVDRSSLDGAFKETINAFKNLDIVINNAGVINEVDWEQCCDVNLKGVVNGNLLAMEEYLPKYKSSSDCVIVNTASTGGLQPADPAPVYTATKFGVVGLTLTLGSDYHFKRTGIRVMAICPGATDTTLFKDVNKRMVHGELMEKATQMATYQDCTVVAKAFIYAIKEGKPGSIHLIAKGEMKEIVYPKIL